MASSPPLYSAGQGAATAPPGGEPNSGPWHTQPPPGEGAGPGHTFGHGEATAPDKTPLMDEDISRPGNNIPVHGPLALSATRYPYTQQHDAGTLNVEYRDSSRLAVLCGRQTHRVLVMVWDELFWILSLPLLLCTTFLLSLIRCVLEAVVRPLVLGPIQLLGDHLLKPLSVVQYDALLLPGVTLAANMATALLLVARPLGQLLDVLVRPLATLLSSFRLVHISYGSPPELAKTYGAEHV